MLSVFLRSSYLRKYLYLLVFYPESLYVYYIQFFIIGGIHR